jgi:hypothetical protein
VETNHLRSFALVEVNGDRISDHIPQALDVIGFGEDRLPESTGREAPFRASSARKTSSELLTTIHGVAHSATFGQLDRPMVANQDRIRGLAPALFEGLSRPAGLPYQSWAIPT